jgi:aminoglycoside phosphotransferase (APT) family kinase protein
MLRVAQFPPATGVQTLRGRGFDNEVVVATLGDRRKVVLRRWNQPRPPETARAAFLAGQNVPAPAVLATSDEASLQEFVPGVLLGDLIEGGRCTPAAWRSVGAAFRKVHAVRFAPRVSGSVLPDRIVLVPCDPAEMLRCQVDDALPGLRRVFPALTACIDGFHEVIEAASAALRGAATALGHGDMWNIIVGPRRTTLIDWDHPRICDPAMEVALLDKHASLFNGEGLHPAFFDGYGRPAREPNTSIHRVVQTLAWAMSSDWEQFQADPGLPLEIKERTSRWLPVLLEYVERLPGHVNRLHALVPPRSAGG